VAREQQLQRSKLIVKSMNQELRHVRRFTPGYLKPKTLDVNYGVPVKAELKIANWLKVKNKDIM